MREQPILFNAFSVNAIMEGRKTETRRVVKSGRTALWEVDDVLWVRETFGLVWPNGVDNGLIRDKETGLERPIQNDECDIVYRATQPDFIWGGEDGKEVTMWKPSIFMPKSRCRLWLDVIGLEVERVQDITKEGALAEGIALEEGKDPRLAFETLWDSINEKRGLGWKENPLVWVVRFKQRKDKP